MRDKRVVVVLWRERDDWLLAVLKAERAVTGRLKGFDGNHDEDDSKEDSAPHATCHRDAEGAVESESAAKILVFAEADEDARLCNNAGPESVSSRFGAKSAALGLESRAGIRKSTRRRTCCIMYSRPPTTSR